MEHTFRIFDFNVYNKDKSTSDDDMESSDDDNTTNATYTSPTGFMIQIFGVNETGKTCSILVEDFKPFFYVMVNDSWSIQVKDAFLADIKSKILLQIPK